MNILVPDIWLREFLETKATPLEIQKYLSLCGPSVERINKVDKDVVYDIEVTSNRPDSLSVLGIARETAAILPRFGIATTLKNDPYKANTATIVKRFVNINVKNIKIITDSILNPRWTSVILDNIVVGPSPKWLQNLLEMSGIRPINNIVDITNYFMRAFGQPAHAFDYDEIKPKNNTPTMVLRASKKGEKITTLDGKTFTLPGDDIVIEDGSGRLIDLCGIMGGLNSSIKAETKTIVLFMQVYEPSHIRKTSMNLGQRSQAATLFEKGLDPELVLPTVVKAIDLIGKLAEGKVVSQIYDIYTKAHKPRIVSVPKQLINTYVGVELSTKEIANYLKPLGFKVEIKENLVNVSVPSYRQDVQIKEDLIEEIARIYGYHNIVSRLPCAPLAFRPINTGFFWEEEIKVRLRDWGFIEAYTYSMISENLMDIFKFDKEKNYQIKNPLSDEWVYMRPSIIPSLLNVIKENQTLKNEIKTFELSNCYFWQKNDLPQEELVLTILWMGERFLEIKGIASAVFKTMGITFPKTNINSSSHIYDLNQNLELGEFGSLGKISQDILENFGIKAAVTTLNLNFAQLAKQGQISKKYQPLSKFSPIRQDLTFIVPGNTGVGDILETIKQQSDLVNHVNFKGKYKNAITFEVVYETPDKQLTSADVEPHRRNIIDFINQKFSTQIKGSV